MSPNLGIKLKEDHESLLSQTTLIIDDDEKEPNNDKKLNKTRYNNNHHQQREEIQTLRAIAIIGVLLFHLWDSKFEYGFLGVDVFFVISGYLMCRILTAKQPINKPTISTFYERRLKRIVPLYLTIIGLTLFFLYHLVDSIQYHQIVEEALPSMFFVSNWPKPNNDDYFAADSKFFFFLHTWSLSVEIQFYLIVPFIFLISDLLNAKTGRYSTILTFLLLISTIFWSFSRQLFALDPNQEHMALMSRIWQFLCGFLAHGVYERVGKVEKVGDEKSHSLTIHKIPYLISTISLIFILIFGIPLQKQPTRLLIISLTTFIISQPNNLPKLMSNKLMVLLGDISYSIYLIHWPLITWFRYTQMGESNDGIGLEAGLFLLLSSLLLGYIIENIFKYLMKHLSSWHILLVVIFFGFALNSLLMLKLEQNALRFGDDDNDLVVVEDQSSNSTRLLPQKYLPFKPKIPIYDSIKIPDVYFNNQTLNGALNATMIQKEKEKRAQEYVTFLNRSQRKFIFCEDKKSPLPTNYSMNWANYTRTQKCITKGSGKKNIVIIGNSHGSFNYAGIAQAFKDVYKTLVLDVRMTCLPTMLLKYQQTTKSEKEQKECLKYLADYTPTLRLWKEPIDVLIVLFALVDRPDVPFDETNKEKDELFTSMQEFYQQLSRIPKEVMIVQKQGPIFSDELYHVYMSRTKAGRDTKFIGDTKKNMLSRYPNFRKRMNILDCSSKCLKMDFLEDLWCPKAEEEFCNVVDQQTGLLYFEDRHHPTPLGSLKQAKHMRKKYDEWLKESKKGWFRG